MYEQSKQEPKATKSDHCTACGGEGKAFYGDELKKCQCCLGTGLRGDNLRKVQGVPKPDLLK